MAEICRRIGLSLGADICWPAAYQEIMRRLDLKIPMDGDTIRFEVERMRIEPFDLREHVPWDVVIDRLTHWYNPRREWIKKATILDDVYVFNNPWSVQSMEKLTTYVAMMRLGFPIPETWLLPPKEYEHKDDLQVTLERYAQLFDLEQIGAQLGYPLFMKPYDGGGMEGGHQDRRPEGPPGSLRPKRQKHHAPAGGRGSLRAVRPVHRPRPPDPARELRSGSPAPRSIHHGEGLPDGGGRRPDPGHDPWSSTPSSPGISTPAKPCSGTGPGTPSTSRTPVPTPR